MTEFSMPRERKRGRVTRRDNASRGSTGGIRRLLSKQAGEPPVTPLQGAPAEGKRGIRRLMKVDPKDGLSMPEATAITSTHTDVGGRGGYRGVRVLSKVTGAVSSNRGKTTVKPPRLSRGLKRR